MEIPCDGLSFKLLHKYFLNSCGNFKFLSFMCDGQNVKFWLNKVLILTKF